MARYATATKQHNQPVRHIAPTLQGGRSLQPATRARMDARFGHDFSSVRVHSDDAASRLAQSAGAKALTLGSHILFGPGRYAPGGRDSERLLSHELAHVIQQERSGPGDPTRVSQGSDPSEREAENAEDSVAGGSFVKITASPDAAIARDEDESLAFAQRLGLPGEPNACYAPQWGDPTQTGIYQPDQPNSSPTSEGDNEFGLGHALDSPAFDNPYWNTVTNNAISTGTSMAEEYPRSAVKTPLSPEKASSIDKSIQKLESAPQPEGPVEIPDPENWQSLGEPYPGAGPSTPSPAPDAIPDIDRITDRLPSAGAGDVSTPEPPAAPVSPQEQQVNSLFDEPSTVSQELGPWSHPADGGGGLENAARAGSSTEEAIETGSRLASMSKAFNVINKFMNPIGMVSNAVSLRHDIQEGNWMDAAADTAGFTGAGIGTAGSLGLIGEASSLGPVGAAAGSFAGGYAAGSMALGEANDYAKKNDIFGQDRDSTEAAGDAGRWVQNKVNSTFLPDFVGDFLGMHAAVDSSIGTALYSGLHAAGSGIESGAGAAYDSVHDYFKPPQEDNNIDPGAAMDQIDAQETQSELYGR